MLPLSRVSVDNLNACLSKSYPMHISTASTIKTGSTHARLLGEDDTQQLPVSQLKHSAMARSGTRNL